MLLQQIAYASLEKILNRYVDCDPSSQKRMEALRHKTIQLNITGFPLNIFLRFGENKIHLFSDYANKPDVSITGSPLAFVRLQTESPQALIQSGDIKFEGDPSVGQSCQHFFNETKIDWEELLSYCTGDSFSHFISRGLKSVHGLFNDTTENMKANMTEYLQEEKNILPCREAVDDFCADIDELKMGCDRLDARVAMLQDKFKNFKKEQ